MASYNANVPQSGDRMSQSQNDFLNNFGAIDTVVSVNHVDFNDGDEGKHKFMQMPEQALGPATAADEGALYCKESPANAITALFFRDESSGDEIEITGAGKTTDGWAYLASGIILMWGSALVNADSSDTLTFVSGAGIPTYTTMFSAQITKEGAAGITGTAYLETLTTANVTVYNRGSKDVIHYFVIGV